MTKLAPTREAGIIIGRLLNQFVLMSSVTRSETGPKEIEIICLKVC